MVTFQLLTPAGVLETELHFGLLLPYFGRLAGKRSIDFEAFLRELLAPVCPVTGPLVVSGEDPGSACTVTGRWGIIELGDVSLAQWFGGEFGLLEEPGPHELVIEPMPTFASLLAELIAACKDGCVGFAREELATGEEGIVVWACEEDGTRRAELGLDWTCVDAIVSAVDLLTRGEVPPAIR